MSDKITLEGPLISIITATYNSTPFIDRLRKSLEAQTYKRFEWICVDDASRDHTVEIIQSMKAPGQGGLKLYRLPHNTGGCIAWAVAFQKASGQAVMIVDHDDELLPDALETVAAAWPQAEADPDASAITFRISDPATGNLIGGQLEPGTRYDTSWLMNHRPDIHDLSIAFKRADALAAFPIELMENVALLGWPQTLYSRRRHFIAGPNKSIRLYHRDNPDSQTNNIKLSRKTVTTYAGYLSAWDRHYFRTPFRWAKHAVALLRFSADVHGSMNHAVTMVRPRLLKAALIALIPVANLVRARRPKPQVLDFLTFDPGLAAHLPNLRSSEH